VSSISTTVGSLCHLRQQGVRQGRLAGRGAAGDEDVLAPLDREPQHVGLRRRHDAGRNIVGECEHGHSRLTDCEGRRHHHRRQQALETLAGLGQFGGNARATRMHFGPDMMRD
jgi:hypothetical protein